MYFIFYKHVSKSISIVALCVGATKHHAALAGMLDSQSVISAVTFGTMKFETA